MGEFTRSLSLVRFDDFARMKLALFDFNTSCFKSLETRSSPSLGDLIRSISCSAVLNYFSSCFENVSLS